MDLIAGSSMGGCTPRLRRDFICCPDLLLIVINIDLIKYQFDQSFYCTPNYLLTPLLFYLLGPHFLHIWQTNLLIYLCLPNSLTNHQSFHWSSLKLSHLFQIFCAVGKPMFYHCFLNKIIHQKSISSFITLIISLSSQPPFYMQCVIVHAARNSILGSRIEFWSMHAVPACACVCMRDFCKSNIRGY